MRFRIAAMVPSANTASCCLTETPFVLTIRLKIIGNELRYEAESNVGFGATKEPALTGKAE